MPSEELLPVAFNPEGERSFGEFAIAQQVAAEREQVTTGTRH